MNKSDLKQFFDFFEKRSNLKLKKIEDILSKLKLDQKLKNRGNSLNCKFDMEIKRLSIKIEQKMKAILAI